MNSAGDNRRNQESANRQVMMRTGQNKRMRGRNRNNNNNNNSGGGHNRGHHHNPLTRVYESNGPDVKIRGTAHHVVEKYLQLARDAASSGDYVTAEAHNQHAEHYFRLIAAAQEQEQFRQQNPHYQPQVEPRDDNQDGSMDDGDEASGQPPQSPQAYGQQPNFPPRDQQAYSPREQSQPYGGPQPQQVRPQQQQHHQPRPPQQQQPQLQPQPTQPQPHLAGEGSDVERLPSFITGGQPQQPQGAPNGHDNQGERFPLHRRRRRHRGPPNSPQDISGGAAPDDTRPGND
jgi:hypothetical protein